MGYITDQNGKKGLIVPAAGDLSIRKWYNIGHSGRLDGYFGPCQRYFSLGRTAHRRPAVVLAAAPAKSRQEVVVAMDHPKDLTEDLTERFVADLTDSQPRLFAYILSLLRNADEARDVLQETNLVLWKKLAEFADVKSFEAWSTKIAYFQVLAFRRDRGRDRHEFNDQLLGQVAEAAEEAAGQTNARLRFLNGCIERLPDRQRRLVADRYGKQLAVKDLARTMGKTPAALGMTLYRVRQTLMECIESRLQSEGARHD